MRRIKNFFRELYVKNKVGSRYKKLPSSLPDCWPILTDNAFYKFFFCKRSFFEEEKENLLFLERCSNVKEFLPDYNYYDNYFQTEILETITDKDEQLQAATEILSALKKNGKYEYISPENLPYVEIGVKFITCHLPVQMAKKCKRKVIDILDNNQFRIGICHGDFHPKNIMKLKSAIKMIDFDCVREKSIQEFDCLYFVTQMLIDFDFENIWWYQAIGKDMSEYDDFISLFVKEMKNIDDLKFLYSLDRIGQDLKYGIKPDLSFIPKFIM